MSNKQYFDEPEFDYDLQSWVVREELVPESRGIMTWQFESWLAAHNFYAEKTADDSENSVKPVNKLRKLINAALDLILP